MYDKNQGCTLGVISLGCSKNRVDTENMLGLMAQEGYGIVSDPAQADILVVNTCGFIQSAKEEAIDAILEMAAYKENGKCRALVVTGCLTQRYAQELHNDMPEIDVLLGVGNYHRLPGLLDAFLKDGKRRVATDREQDRMDYTSRMLTTPGHMAFLRIADGCDNACSYCAIPMIRGRYKSRDMADIRAEAETLAQRGVKDLILVAQDSTRYGRDLQKQATLAALLNNLCEIKELEWIRVLYCYGHEVSEELLGVMSAQSKIVKYLDIPFQHIDAGVLKGMRRRETTRDIYDVIDRIRGQKEPFALRSTLMVGFPGEDDAAFGRLMEFIQFAQFDHLGAFAYSMEENTPAASMPNQVPEDVKQARLDALMRAQAVISLNKNKQRVGSVHRCIVDKVTANETILRTKYQAPEIDGVVRAPFKTGVQAGLFADIRIIGCDTYDLMGEWT